MRLSRFFLPILKENPKEAEIVSHRLMLRAGMIRQEAAGIYAWLPLGFRVLKKIEQIVREEQDRAGALELLMPTLQLADLWRETLDVTEWNLEVVAAFLRAAYGKGYCDALTEDAPGSLCHEHGYRIPARKPDKAPKT